MRGDHTEQTMPRTLHDAASAPAALTAFLRGVERRGAVFAQLQVGDAATGDRALVAAMRAFRLPAAKIPFADWPRQRSEEHTSELQSLMRISYAVLCLKKKKITTMRQQRIQRQHNTNHHYNNHTTTHSNTTCNSTQ